MSISAAVIRIAKAEPRQELKIVWVAVLIFILTAIIACTGIRASLEFGRLSVPPTYDDVVYFISAVKWLAVWPSRSVAESFYALLNEHAPVSTVMAIAGFLSRPGTTLARTLSMRPSWQASLPARQRWFGDPG